MSDVWDEIEQELDAKMREVQSDFRRTSRSEFDKGSGKLARGFRPTKKYIGGDLNSIHWSMPRYGYILHHGVEKGTQATGLRSFTFQKGIRSSGFISDVMERHFNEISDIFTEATADHIVKLFKF